MSRGTGNATSTDQSHAKIIENILPLLGLRGVSPLYGFIGSWLGVEPSLLLTAFGMIWAFNKLFRQLYSFVYSIVVQHFTSSIYIRSPDDIYMHLTKWLATQPRLVNSRSLMAETSSKEAWEDEDASNVTRDKSGSYLNFSHQEARTPAQYVPAIGLHGFWWRGHYFTLTRKREMVFAEGVSGAYREHEDITISCFWRSPQPIKQFLAHIKQVYYSNHQARTIVKRPSRLGIPRYAGRAGNWQQVANRPVRDIRTVVLDEHQKLKVLADINEYLHPETPRWYANRGIPLRRGYLFHGPPGTGKTSLSFALAGIFGLDIHVISLLEPSLTEEDLGALFASLPRRCIVLLEDIDTAGLRRPPPVKAAGEDEAGSSGNSGHPQPGRTTRGHNNNNAAATTNGNTAAPPPHDWKVSDLAKALKKDDNPEQRAGISLSGLLNAIDGVASHEGRVLIMTTNLPNQLDDALIRPGRIDLQVAFTNATRDQARELFIRMYEGDPKREVGKVGEKTGTSSSSSSSPTAATTNGTMKSKPETGAAAENGSAETPSHDTAAATETDGDDGSGLDIRMSELPDVARQFSLKAPDGELSPAQIQGYLLKRKKHPRRAVEEADAWVEGLMKQKVLRTNVMEVQ
ncbi:BCS1 N terminal-domain-containing protein [Hypoxylon rubiginosum]|uniref:BCS1 N terminal-domain-containing protein n=1 Tax=Hypoxylon rubiginosum TaxID=110542 RepID=A0ACB9Z8E6_9PEZI|nr:BCS1 N terminal-domain-containing protein [Hypoxylon rubiginosum]